MSSKAVATRHSRHHTAYTIFAFYYKITYHSFKAMLIKVQLSVRRYRVLQTSSYILSNINSRIHVATGIFRKCVSRLKYYNFVLSPVLFPYCVLPCAQRMASLYDLNERILIIFWRYLSSNVDSTFTYF